ncbi:MAG: hypothetical protein AAFO07_10160, partial [Bacteroidota bacterium]
MKTNLYTLIIILTHLHFFAFAQSDINLLSNWDYRRQVREYEKINKVIATTNGFIVAVGETLSKNRDNLDGLFLVIDAEDGSRIHWKRFGGSGEESFNSVVQNHDGTFTLVGYSQAKNNIDKDGWVVQLDIEGNKLKEHSPKSSLGIDDELYDVAINSDGVILASGMHQSKKTPDLVWLVDIGYEGINNEFTLGNGMLGQVQSMTATPDGSFVLTGSTNTKDRNHPNDIWAMKIDHTGKDLWGETHYFGDRGFQEARDITFTAEDGGYAIIGANNSKGAGASDMWLLKLDDQGELVWDKTYGGANADLGNAVIELSGGELAILGQTWSHMPRARTSTLKLIVTDQRGNEIDSDTYIIYNGEGDEVAY